MNLPKVKAILFKAKTYSDGTHPILIRLTLKRVRLYKSVGFSVPSESWDDDKGLVWEKRPIISKRQEGQLNEKKLKLLKANYGNVSLLTNAKHINTNIQDSITEVNNIIQLLHVNGEDVDLKTIKEKLNPKSQGDREASFFTYAKERQDLLHNLGSIGTSRSYNSVIAKFRTYLKGKDIQFLDLNLKLLQDYEAYMVSKGLKTNTIHNNFKILRAIYYAAQKEEIVPTDKNPFFIFKLKLDSQIKKDKLTVEEIIAIEKLSLEEGSLIWHVRYCFLFSFYCAGIRVSDLLQLKWQNISSADRIEYKMDKTGSYKSIALLPKAKAILSFYKKEERQPGDFIFPLLNTEANLHNPTILHAQLSAKTTIINKYLKTIAELAKIDKVLSSHIARHSFSDIARKRGASLYDISKLLSHSSIKITEAYLATLDIESQDTAHRGALDF